jgi:diaminopimelate epimerase
VLTAGRSFFKLSGSGNDFVFIDTRSEPAGKLEEPSAVQAVCARGTGVGADGVVFLSDAKNATIAIRYLNSDGSLAVLCGNATLCAARMAVELGLALVDREFSIETGSGTVTARVRNGVPEIDLQPVTELLECFEAEPSADERRIGFARVGVPHLVVLCRDVEAARVLERGRTLRHDPRLQDGANVNFVARSGNGWRIRTYERGVESETLACGTGAVATGLLLSAWGESKIGGESIELFTRSGRTLAVRHRIEGDRLYPSLSGEARIVFVGQLGELPGSDR